MSHWRFLHSNCEAVEQKKWVYLIGRHLGGEGCSCMYRQYSSNRESLEVGYRLNGDRESAEVERSSEASQSAENCARNLRNDGTHESNTPAAMAIGEA